MLLIHTNCGGCSRGGTDEHSCQVCMAEIEKGECLEYCGYCETCFGKVHGNEECKCCNPVCSECLNGGCRDENCPVHDKESGVFYG